MEYVKKYWFVALIGILFISASVYFGISEKANTFVGKEVNGEDVLFEYNGNDVTANSLFNEVFSDKAKSLSTYFIQYGIYDVEIETTAEIREKAKAQTESVISYYKYTYGEEYENYILPTLRYYGYSSIDDLERYFETYYKMTEYQLNYYIEKYYEEFNKEKAPRIISHILVKMTDSENPTEEELAKIAQIDEALKSGKTFEDVAKEYSDDSTSTEGGLLGYADANSSFVEGFFDGAKNLEDGEISEWVKTQYGYHLIKCNSTKIEDLKAEDDFYSSLSQTYNADLEIFKMLYKKHEVDYHGNEDIRKYIEDVLLKDEESEEAK